MTREIPADQEVTVNVYGKVFAAILIFASLAFGFAIAYYGAVVFVGDPAVESVFAGFVGALIFDRTVNFMRDSVGRGIERGRFGWMFELEDDNSGSEKGGFREVSQ